LNSRYDKVLAQSTIYELSLRGSMAHESSTSMYIKEIHKTMTEKIEQVQAVVVKKEGIIKHLESQLRKCAVNTENQKKINKCNQQKSLYGQEPQALIG